MVSKSTLAQEWPVYRPPKWGEPTKSRALPRPWWGLDTERDARTGEYVCGFAVGETTFKFDSLRDLKPGTYWVWNLGYDVEGLLRDLRLEDAWCARADGARFELDGGRAVYYHGKRFEWMAPNGRIILLEASSFFGRCPLKAIGAKEGVDASKMSLARYQTDPEYRAEVDSYCQQDARIVYDAILDLSLGVGAIGVELASTPGGTARRFLTRMGNYPRVIWQTHTAFLRSYCGGRFEITKRGVFDDAYQYDITSAYPWALSKCPWLTETARHRRVNSMTDDGLYGSYLVDFKTDEYLGLAPQWHEGVRVYSNAENGAWLTRPEVEWLQDNGYDYKIRRGVEIHDENASNLWEQVIQELFAMKQRGKGKPEGFGAKIVLNSMYGILIQLVRKSGKWVPLQEAVNPVDFAGLYALEEPPKAFDGGKYYAPVYASNLTALTRIKLLDTARACGENYVGGHTDSVLTTKPLHGLEKGLGGWELEAHARDAQVAKTGMYAMDDKVKMRGISREGTAAMLWEPKHTRRTRIGIKSASEWEQVSRIVEREVANNVQVEKKRHWLRELTPDIIESRRFIDSEALRYVAS